jgi:predicted metal-dependent peptidase
VKNKQDTSNDLPVHNLSSEEEAANFEIDAHLVRLMFDEPFYAHILRSVKLEKSDAIPTAGVLAQDGEVRMWWNPRFLASLTEEEVQGLLIHECWHIVLQHTTSRRMDPHRIHNYATDLAINSNIPERMLPEGGLIPGTSFPKLSDDQIKMMGQEAVDRYNLVSDKIASFPKHKSSEWYFARLMEDKEVSKSIQEDSQGKSLLKALADGDVHVDEDGNLVDKNGNPVSILPGSMDHHDEWEDSGDEQKALIDDKVKKALEKAVKESDRSGKWGSVSSSMRSELRQIISNEVDWRMVLKRFVGNSRRGTRSTSWTRLNKKYAGRVQGVKRGYTSSIAIYIDQSGSVGNDALELAFGNLRNLSKKTSFTTFHFDSQVDLESETTWKRGKTPECLRTMSGGTCFESVTKHANENKHRFDGYLVITDGEAPKPSPSRLKRGWLITPERSLIFNPDNSDFVIKMKAEAV